MSTPHTAGRQSGFKPQKFKPRRGHPPSETLCGHSLYTGEVVHSAFWDLMQSCLMEQRPQLRIGQTYLAQDLIGPLWDRMTKYERQRMGRCIRSHSLQAMSGLRLVSNVSKSRYPRRYQLV